MEYNLDAVSHVKSDIGGDDAAPWRALTLHRSPESGRRQVDRFVGGHAGAAPSWPGDRRGVAKVRHVPRCPTASR